MRISSNYQIPRAKQSFKGAGVLIPHSSLLAEPKAAQYFKIVKCSIEHFPYFVTMYKSTLDGINILVQKPIDPISYKFSLSEDEIKNSKIFKTKLEQIKLAVFENVANRLSLPE